MPPSLISPDRNEIDFVKQAQAYINWKYPKKSIPMSFINKSTKHSKPLVLSIPSQHIKTQQFVSEYSANWRDTIQQRVSPRTPSVYNGHSPQYIQAQIEQLQRDIYDLNNDKLQLQFAFHNTPPQNRETINTINEDIQNIEWNLQELNRELRMLQSISP